MDNFIRKPQTEIDATFIERWSPRAFNGELLKQWQIDSLLEAAKWAPSCYNDQPWQFAYAATKADIELFSTALVDRNRLWAPNAGLLMFLVYRKDFAQTGEPNNWAFFDCGAAWMSLALQATKLGLYAHGMAGFKPKKTAEILGLNTDTHDIAIAIAAGYIGDKNSLPEEFIELEAPSPRKDLNEVVWDWK